MSAFLLFQVQPLISKMILPWFGGGPAVWTTCMLFFQVLLLGGYTYAHLLQLLPRLSWQTITHVAILAIAAFTLPITPATSWKPADASQPTVRILLLLAANVGLPYFALASTGPLVQAWFGRVLAGASPYRLYALSNVGSLGALLTYPFIVEPMMTVSHQGTLWSVLFGLFALLCGLLATASAWHICARQRSDDHQLESLPPAASTNSLEDDRRPTSGDRLSWLLLPSLASLLLLAVTNHLCQDVAAIPFLWVLPLTLYLLTFIICFDREAWYRPRLLSLITVTGVLVLSFALLEREIESVARSRFSITVDLFNAPQSIVAQCVIYLGLLFLVCMVCHGELVRRKPPTKWLTSFYLAVSAGGALGGIFVAIVCPQIFTSYLETGVGLSVGFLLAAAVAWRELRPGVLSRVWPRAATLAATGLALIVVLHAQLKGSSDRPLKVMRSFYGVLRVVEYDRDQPDIHVRALQHGRIFHGIQFQRPERRAVPTAYFSKRSGIGVTLSATRRDEPLRIGVIGLGAGTLAAYCGEDDQLTFYELSPDVADCALDYFTFISDARQRGAIVNIEMGDARISMERQPPQHYDVMILDAFSSDAIPAHLLTREAFEEYLRHIKPNGVIAVHISNRHLDLTPVVAGAAKSLDVPAVVINHQGNPLRNDDAVSSWAMLSRNSELFSDPSFSAAATDLGDAPTRLWTDQYSNLLQILR